MKLTFNLIYWIGLLLWSLYKCIYCVLFIIMKILFIKVSHQRVVIGMDHSRGDPNYSADMRDRGSTPDDWRGTHRLRGDQERFQRHELLGKRKLSFVIQWVSFKYSSGLEQSRCLWRNLWSSTAVHKAKKQKPQTHKNGSESC